MTGSSKYKVIISERARQMLETHIRFIAQVNKDAARSQKQQIVNAIRSLSRMPQRFPFFDDIHITSNKYHKIFVKKQYLILYQIQDNNVYVDYILDCRRDYGWIIR